MTWWHLFVQCAALALTVFVVTVLGAADPNPGMPPSGPLSPKEELATFKVAKGFRVELIASEPDVVDPVAMAFDENGRLFVAEMPGYPNGGVATGNISSGRVKLLTEPDDKGVYRKSTLFAGGLRLPSSVMPWKGGLIVAVAPDVFYFDDKDGKGDGKRVLYTGFDLDNSEQLINGLQWGLDNWVYGCAGGKGGTITSGEKKDAPAVTLRGRGVRFHPEVPGSLEPMSGGGQYGLAADDGQHWFTNTNNQHLRHIVLPDHYLRRNPFLTVKAVTLDIPDGKDGHGAVCKVHRISPFEAWRVERTKLRVEGKVPGSSEGGHYGGYITSSCSPAIYTADLFPAAYRGNSFICEPANNLVHRDILEPKGATFSARRADADSEFLAATDIWFRPVFLTVGPDGALYVADFYREVIETPLSLPEDIKKKLNIESRGRGRIWRIVPDGFKQPPQPKLRQAASDTLVKHLAHANAWWRLTAQRLLIERQDKSVIAALMKLAAETGSPVGRCHALWTLHGLNGLEDGPVEAALKDKSPLVREQALRLAENRLAKNASLRTAAAQLADDADGHVRFQLALSLGEADTPETSVALARLLRKDGADPWFQTAILSSAGKSAPSLLDALVGDKDYLKRSTPAEQRLLGRLASLVAARASDADLAGVLKLLDDDSASGPGGAWQLAILEGLGEGLKSSGRPLSKLWDQPPAALKDAVTRVRPFFGRAAVTARDDQRPVAERLAAVGLLGYGPFAAAGPPLKELLAPTAPGELNLAAVRALSFQDSPQVAEILLAQWGSYGPALRREVLEALFARSDRLKQLLDAVEAKKVLPAQLEPARLEQLRKHPSADLRKRAAALLGAQVAPDRQKVIDAYKTALDLKADIAQGKMVFKRVCTTCHRLENEGKEVGPDLLAALRTKTRDTLLIDILDPSREVDPRFINYVVSTKDGRILTGMIAVEAPTSITLRRAEKAEDTILRAQIEEIQATAKSLMPDELEKQLTKQEMADVIAYLLSVVASPK